MEKIFRALVITTTLFYIAYYFMPYIDYLWLKDDEIVFLSSNGAKALVVIPDFILHAIFTLWVITAIGLYLYKPIAKKLFLGLVIFTTLLNLLSGYAALSPIEVFLLDTSNMIDGALLVFIYFTSISAKFERSA